MVDTNTRRIFTEALGLRLEAFVAEGGAQGWEISRDPLGHVRGRLWWGVGDARQIATLEVLAHEIEEAHDPDSLGDSTGHSLGLDLLKLMRMSRGLPAEPDPLE